MKANPTKFQAICIGKRAHVDITSFHIDLVEIKCEDNATLLGININFMLRFHDYVSQICKKSFQTTRSLEVHWSFLKRLGL